MAPAAAAAAAGASATTPLLDKKEREAAKKARKEARRAQRRVDAAASSETAAELGLPATAVNVTAASSVAGRALPDIPELQPGAVTICLLYQYREPAWTNKQHNRALNDITEIAIKHVITGRGRCAPEGLNCTLTGSASNMRAFCYGLREWDPMFLETDFKLTDNVPASTQFGFFTLRKVDELVAYGLAAELAPSLQHHAGTHLEAVAYHQQMTQKDTVIIDVRNAYESAIGHFQPPPGGAQLLDPKMRNSSDFPKWLNAPETKEQLQGKTVMMYCTGGIRCERATALLNQMTDVAEDFETKEVVMVRGGIERYLKTFPEGGYWQGQNYLFDQRKTQVPEQKTAAALKNDIESVCCLCATPYAEYNGQHKCHQILPATGLPCDVPVLVCSKCQDTARKGQPLACPLCVEGYQPPTDVPDLVGQKRKLGIINNDGTDCVTGKQLDTEQRKKVVSAAEPSRILLISRLPLRMTASALRDALTRAARSKDATITSVHWIVDRETQGFYGSAVCEMEYLDHAESIVKSALANGGLEVGKGMRSKRKRETVRRARVVFCPNRKTGEPWPSNTNHCESEYPPVGN